MLWGWGVESPTSMPNAERCWVPSEAMFSIRFCETVTSSGDRELFMPMSMPIGLPAWVPGLEPVVVIPVTMLSVTTAPEASGSTWTPNAASAEPVTSAVCCSVNPFTVTLIASTSTVKSFPALLVEMIDSGPRPPPVAGIPALAPSRVTGWVIETFSS